MLLPRIERFLRTTQMSSTRFGRLAAHDPRLVLDMRNGREPRSAMVERVEGFMSGYLAASARIGAANGDAMAFASPASITTPMNQESAHVR